jgi:pimeloyl-ACP methyl ester carboxylesterase
MDIEPDLTGATAPDDCFRGGSGPPLLLLHSGLCTWREWRGVFPRLGREHDVMAPTLPGSLGGPPLRLRGRSMLAAMADEVEGLLDDAGWDEPVAIVGSSHGGVTALELAARGRAQTVVALAPPWLSTATATMYGGLLGAGSAVLRLTWPITPLTARLPRTGGLLLHGSATPAALDTADLLTTLRSVRRFPWLRLGWQGGMRPPLRPDFERIHCPVTIVWGTRDRLVPSWMARRWVRAMPQAELVVLPGFPHVPQLRDADRIANLILEQTGE